MTRTETFHKMKLTIAILFCVVLSLQYSADGIPQTFLNDYRQRVHNSLSKVRQNLNSLFPGENKKVQQNNDAASSIVFREEKSEEDFAAAAAAARKPVEVTTPPTVPTTVATTVKPVETTTKNATDGDDKGRENFAAGCATGYQRTADGRCKPTFG